MKKTILLVWTIILGLCLTCFAAAKEEKLTLTATASSMYSSSYSPAKAVDGNFSTSWIGGYNATPWWIKFDAGGVKLISNIKMFWYSTSYLPKSYDIQISSDGTNWQNLYTGISAIYNSSTGEVRVINRETRYVRLYIYTLTSGYYPYLKEFEAYKPIYIPHLLRFQGNLGDSYGVPLSGLFTLKFKIYDGETGGTPLWQETQSSINIEEGVLDVELGSVTPLNLSFEKQYWLGIEVGSDGEMTPRFKLTSVPYSLISER